MFLTHCGVHFALMRFLSCYLFWILFSFSFFLFLSLSRCHARAGSVELVGSWVPGKVLREPLALRTYVRCLNGRAATVGRTIWGGGGFIQALSVRLSLSLSFSAFPSLSVLRHPITFLCEINRVRQGWPAVWVSLRRDGSGPDAFTMSLPWACHHRGLLMLVPPDQRPSSVRMLSLI